MTPQHVFVTLMFSLLLCNHVSAQKASGDEEAIKKVLDLETRAYFTGKYDQWASTWLHDSSVFRMSMSPTDFYKVTGWNTMTAGMKESMQNATPATEEEMAPYLHKFDYTFYINGNTAHVFFKEGKTEQTANDEERLMVKQNGEWKIRGITIVNTPMYKFSNDVQKLKTWVGKWSIVKGSYKSEPSDTAFTWLSLSSDIHEIMNGVEISSIGVSRYSQNTNAVQEVEQFVADNALNKFWYHDNAKFNNNSGGSAGTAEFDSTGNFVVTVMYDDKPVVKLKNIYTLNKDASLHLLGEFYTKDGKKSSSWSYDLSR